jgi:hypothetical protein
MAEPGTCMDENYEVELNPLSDFSRSVLASSKTSTSPNSPRIHRQYFPQTDDPHICLAFLSCCDRIDLLKHTIEGAIRHMENDEPEGLKYEIAWVDNGSDNELVQTIMDSYQIEHALPLDKNLGLAYGMNLLIHNLCTAPYILLLEEDWLYLDDLIVDQSKIRKSVIASAISLTEMNLVSFDGREVMGVFLRPETYHSFLKKPFIGEWMEIYPKSLFANDFTLDQEEEPIRYQVICADSSANSRYIWGSYTNGAGLYRRSSLKDIGRMYGEAGDAFHDRYTEGNYAYRAGIKYCHAAIQLGDCSDLGNLRCTAAFQHIGGGRGTLPMKPQNLQCASELWNFVGTPLFHLFLKAMGDAANLCSNEMMRSLKKARAMEINAEEYREEVKERNKQAFEKEDAERKRLLSQAQQIRNLNKDWARQNIDWMSDYTDEKIEEVADKMERIAKSPHPLAGFWDSHGRPLV